MPFSNLASRSSVPRAQCSIFFNNEPIIELAVARADVTVLLCLAGAVAELDRVHKWVPDVVAAVSDPHTDIAVQNPALRTELGAMVAEMRIFLAFLLDVDPVDCDRHAKVVLPVACQNESARLVVI